MRALALLAILLGASVPLALAGTAPTAAAGGAPTPVVLLHGIPEGATAVADRDRGITDIRGAFGDLPSALEATGVLDVYYVRYLGCDATPGIPANRVIDLTASGAPGGHGGMLGPERTTFGGRPVHAQACGGAHNLDTRLEHLSHHLAWALRSSFGTQCIKVAALSSGGLIIRHALAEIERRAGQAGSPYPADLCVSDVVTLGTPHAGTLALTECLLESCRQLFAGVAVDTMRTLKNAKTALDIVSGCAAATALSLYFEIWLPCGSLLDIAADLALDLPPVEYEIEGQSAFLKGLRDKAGLHPDGAVGSAPGRTRWTAIGSSADAFAARADGMVADETVFYRETSVSGSTYLRTPASRAGNAQLDWFSLDLLPHAQTSFLPLRLTAPPPLRIGEPAPPASPYEIRTGFGEWPAQWTARSLAGSAWTNYCGQSEGPGVGTYYSFGPGEELGAMRVPPGEHLWCHLRYHAPASGAGYRVVVTAESQWPLDLQCVGPGGTTNTPPGTTARCVLDVPGGAAADITLRLHLAAPPGEAAVARLRAQYLLPHEYDRPSAVTAPAVVSEPTGVHLSWGPPLHNAGDLYEVLRWRAADQASPRTFHVERAPTGGRVTFTDPDAVSTLPGERVGYAVRPSRTSGNHGPWSAPQYVTVGEGWAPPPTAPGAPTSLVARASATTASLSWEPPASDGRSPIVAYRVHFGTSADPPHVATTSATTRTHAVSGLAPGQVYHVRVSAVNAQGEGPAASTSTAPAGAPSAPTGLVAAPGDRSVTLSWTAPDARGSGITGYRVYRMEPGSGSKLIATPGAPNYPDTGVTNGVTYDYLVTAVNGVGEGPATRASAMPTASNPSPGGYKDAWIVDWGWDVGYRDPQARPQGEFQDFWVQVYNSGTTDWVGSGPNPFQLGIVGDNRPGAPEEHRFHMHLIDTPDNDNRISLAPGEVVKPFHFKTFRARISAPTYIAWHAITFQMVQDGVGWFGQTTPTFWVHTYAKPNAAEVVVAVPPPLTMQRGEMYPVSVRVHNTGSTTWAYAGSQPYGLGFTDDNAQGYVVEFDERGIVDEDRIRIPASEPVRPGEWRIFNFNIGVGPRMTAGPHTLQFRMVQDHVEWFGDKTSTHPWNVEAIPARNEARLDAWSVGSATLPSRGSTPVSVTVTNTGLNTWQPGSLHYLGLVGDNCWECADEHRWHLADAPYLSGHNRIGFAPGESVPPGATKTFSFTLVAPEVPTTQTLSFQMVQDHVEWFGDATAATTFTVHPGPPTAPTQAHATPGDAAVTLTWGPPTLGGGTPLTSYKVYASPTAGVPIDAAHLVADVGTATSYTHTGLRNGAAVHYRIVAQNAAGGGPATPELSATPFTAPAPPEPLALAGDRNVRLSWSPRSDGGDPITGYSIYASATPGVPIEPAYLLATPGTSTTYDHLGLANGAPIHYRIVAHNRAGAGAPSHEVVATPATVPSAPTALSATRGDARVTLAWAAPASNGGSAVGSYTIYASTTAGFVPGDATVRAVVDAPAFLDLGVANGVTTYYRVAATNGVGTGPLTAEVSARPATLPAAPVAPHATRGDRLVSLSWTPPPDGGERIDLYHVHRDTSSGFAASPANRIATVTAAAYADTTVTNGVLFHYRIAAENAVGVGPASGELSILPARTPDAPSGLTPTPGNGAVTLEWSTPYDGGEPITHYAVHRATSANVPPGSSTYIGSTTSPSTRYDDLGLVNGVTYHYRIVAHNAMGAGSPTLSQSARPSAPPGPVGDLTATAGHAEVTLRWDWPADNGGRRVTAFDIYRGTSLETMEHVDTVTPFPDPWWQDTKLTNGVTYHYVVHARNGRGTGPGVEAQATPAPAPPSAPLNLVARVAGREVALTWLPPANDGGTPVALYEIRRIDGTQPRWTLIGTSTTTSFRDVAAVVGSRNDYSVRAISAAGVPSELSTGERATPLLVGGSAPAAPTGFAVVAGHGNATLSWGTPTSSAPITGYKVYRAPAGSTPIYLATLPAATNSWVDGTMRPDGAYTYRVSALNEQGESVASPAVDVTPLSPNDPNGPYGSEL